MAEIKERFAAEIKEIAAASRRLGELGYCTSHGGNLSYRVAPEVVLITPTKVEKRRIQADDICAVDPEGKTLHARPGRKPTGETPMHLHLLNRRPDANALLHAHPPVMTGFACSRPELLRLPVLPEPTIELGPAVLVDYAEPLTDELARAFEKHLGRHDLFLMQNHGVMLLSREGIARAVDLIQMAEQAAASVLVAELLGGVRPLSKEQVADLDRTSRTRNLPFPGAPGAWKSLMDIFFGEG